MKSTLPLVVLILLTNPLKAQLDKGIWLVGGNGSFYSYTEKFSTPAYNQTAKITSVDLSGTVGYFIVDKFATGLRPNLTSYDSKVVSSSVAGNVASTVGFQIAVGPFARYYFLNKEKPINLLADVGYQFGANIIRVTPTQRGKFNGFSFMGGTAIFFNSTASVEILLGYKQRIESIENSPNAYDRDKRGLQVAIGFTLHLEKL